jgi:hypothetical protein
LNISYVSFSAGQTVTGLTADQHAREKLQYSIMLLQQSCFTASSNIHFIVTQLLCHSESNIGLLKHSAELLEHVFVTSNSFIECAYYYYYQAHSMKLFRTSAINKMMLE